VIKGLTNCRGNWKIMKKEKKKRKLHGKEERSLGLLYMLLDITVFDKSK